ncbi:radical SAM/SPASM domain-containing protein [Streptomyces sp. UNOC14_S4]|uniref:radical SAM/SPASM domain-containing protein n=1 Tax=Streptomyces sp. UNOC14_S4 TaxID=2872340 RepID=UPI001E43615F|nr:radical SAM protein [Streptomyces sp. UNOC14_S4]MCC3769268.1 SPASM domain-containing protein [Streptomyces sp. UNOC14_S4]
MSAPVYQSSRYVRTVRTTGDQDFTRFGGRLDAYDGGDSTVAFHALFGNARLVDRDTVELLREAASGLPLDRLTERAGDAAVRSLIEAQYLVEAGHDEASEIDGLLAARSERLSSGVFHSSIQLVLTNACNFSCQGCFAYNFDGGVEERNHSGESVKPGPVLVQLRTSRGDSAPTLARGDWNDDAGDQARNPSMHMSPAVAEKTIREAVALRKANGGGELTVSFFGGEPTLARGTILHVLRTFGDRYDGVALSYDMTSNGSRIDAELLAALAEHRVATTVSIDYLVPGTGEFRGGQQQRTGWPVVRKAVLDLKAAGVPVSITSVLSHYTWDKWGTPLIDFVAEAGLDSLDVIVSFQAREFFERHSPHEVAQRLLAAVDHGRERGVQLSGYWYQTFQMIADERKWAAQADYKTCPAVGRQLSIEPNGSVFACKATARRLGTIDDWRGVFASPAYRDYGMRAYTNGPGCRGCELQGTCSGGSAGALEEENGSIQVMSPGYCAYMREVVQGLLERHHAQVTAAV